MLIIGLIIGFGLGSAAMAIFILWVNYNAEVGTWLKNQERGTEKCREK